MTKDELAVDVLRFATAQDAASCVEPPTVRVTETEDEFEVKVSQMYEYIFDIKFSTLEALSKIFHTKNFDVDHWAISGCETCDYGSQYTHVFTIKKKDMSA